VDHPAQIGFVEPHPQGVRRDQPVHVVVQQSMFQFTTAITVHPAVVRFDVEATGTQPLGDRLDLVGRQAVDDAGRRQVWDVLGEPGQSA